jgi:hypothetical protein
MQRYINAIFAILVGVVFVVGIYLIDYQGGGAPKDKQSQLADSAMSGGAGAGIGIGVLLSLICLVVFPRFRMIVIGPIGAPTDGYVVPFLRPIRIVIRLGMFLAFISIIAGKLGSMLLA